jgi:hypothetical protein
MEAVRDRGGDLFSIGTHHHHQILVPAWARLGPGMPKRDNDMKLESKQRVLTFTMLPFLIDFVILGGREPGLVPKVAARWAMVA